MPWPCSPRRSPPGRADRRQIRPDQVQKVENILALLDATQTIDDIDLPGLRLHPLKGGLWAVSVSANWRVIFRFADGDVFDVDFLDYH
jgi:toxin HigB-1